MIKQIITSKNVDFTFDSEPCRLLREIVSSQTNKTGRSTYVVETKLVKFEDYTLKTYDQNGDVILDDNGNEVLETKQKLVELGIKQKGGVLIADKQQSDVLFSLIKDTVLLTDSFFDFKEKIELMALLVETQNQAPYGTNPEDWEIYVEQN